MENLKLTPSQWWSVARAVLLIVSGVLIQRGFLTQNQADNIIKQVTDALPAITSAVTVIAPILVTVWGIFSHSLKSKIKDVAESPAVEKVVVVRNAPVSEPAAVLAADPTVPKVAFATNPNNNKV